MGSSYEGEQSFPNDLELFCTVVTKPRDVALEATDPLGVDLGLKDFMTPSTGPAATTQRFYRHRETQLAVAQRAGKTDRVRALHAKIANRRQDFLHQLSAEQVRTHRASFVGNGNATWLTQTNPARSVLDAGWSSYRTMLKYQCDDAGAWFQEIDESFTTQACHMCGARLGPKGRAELDVREWTCAVCGTLHDRDANAARNIKARGLAWLAEQFAMADQGPVPVESLVPQHGVPVHVKVRGDCAVTVRCELALMRAAPFAASAGNLARTTMTIEIAKEARTQAIASIERYFRENMDEPIGNIGAGALLGFFLEEIGPVIYNQAVAEVQERLQQRVMEVDVEVHKDEFQYWNRHDVRRRRR